MCSAVLAIPSSEYQEAQSCEREGVRRLMRKTIRRRQANDVELRCHDDGFRWTRRKRRGAREEVNEEVTKVI